MKHDQLVFLDKISHKVENWSCWIKNQVIRSNLRKNVCSFYLQYFRPIIMKLDQNDFLDKISEIENGLCRVKN